MDKSELVKSIQEGDESAFREMVESYQQMVLGTARGFVGNLEDAQDITQEVFVEIFRSIKTFRSESSLSTWIYRITITRSLNHIRREKRHKGPLQEIALINNDTPDKVLEEDDRKRILNSAIATLPENQRIAFVLHNYKDLPYQEIARIMNRSLSSVESLIFRARKNLQKKLWAWYKKSRV